MADGYPQRLTRKFLLNVALTEEGKQFKRRLKELTYALYL